MVGQANIANTNVVPASTVGSPYYDDYNESKYYHRILFRPGNSVQARELTQMQTIAQNQIERFGRSIYSDGSLVSGGQISLDYATTINLAPQYANSDINVAQFVGKTIAYGSTNTYVQAIVVGASSNSASEPPSLTVKYLTGNEFNNGDTVMVPNTSIIANVAAASSNQTGTIASISDGIFFFSGYFVKAPGQTIVVAKYSNQANARVGLQMSDSIITESEDTSLLDPAQESSNYQAPGATRYQVLLELAVRSLTSTDDSKFSELMRIENGVVKKKVIYPIYSDLEDTLARRTYDESGSYTVRPFRLALKDHPTDANSIMAVIDPGKAYVFGYEFETIAQTQIPIPRARDTVSVNNFNMNMAYGFYLTAGDGRGFLDHTEPMIVDFHSVPHRFIANTNVASGAPYRATKIGTGRIRMVTYDGASNTADQATRTYRLFMFDTQFANLRGNVATAGVNTITLYDPNGANVFSTNSGAYIGATLRFTSNLGVGQSVIVSGYSVDAGGVKTVTTNTNFTTTPNNRTTFSLDFDSKDVRSIVSVVGANTGAANVWTKYNVTDVSRQGGSTYFQESTDQSLVFPFPQTFLKAGSILAPSVPNYQYKKVFTGVQFTNGTISSPASGIQVDGVNEQFNAPSGTSGGTTTAVLSNYIVYVTNPSATGRSNGDIVQLGSIAVSGGGGGTHFTQMTTDGSVASDTFVATIVATVEIIAGGETSPKAKTKYTANTTHYNPTSAASNGSFQQVYDDTTSNTTVYLQNGQVLIQSPSKVPGQKQSLFISDAIRVVAIYDIAGAVPSFGASLSGYQDVTSRFIFNNGQNDNFYDHASVALRSSINSITGPLLVITDWYDHVAGYTSSGLGYFTIDSYPNANTTAGYADIPTYRQSDGKEYSLRDCIDYRPRRTNASNTNPGYSFQGLRLPVPNQNFEVMQYQYYLARRDKLVLTKDRQFRLVSGVSDLNPQDPNNISDSMILYKLYSPPYTLFTSNVVVNYIENKRYTMRDIGALETRIQNLEYYTTLSLLEKDATDVPITDDLGLQRSKYGVIVDSFGGHSIGDVTNPDYDCSMDLVDGGMTSRNYAVADKLYYAANSGVKILGQAALLNYTEETFVTQSVATKTENVQPYMFANYAGTLNMFPDADIWVDTITVPIVVINPGGQNDNIVSVPPRQNGQVVVANTAPPPDPRGATRRWWQESQFGWRDRPERRVWTGTGVNAGHGASGQISIWQ